MDFRDHFIKEALDRAVGPYRPEKRLWSRVVRIAAMAALAVAACVAVWSALDHSSPKSAPPGANRKPVSVQILPAPPGR